MAQVWRNWSGSVTFTPSTLHYPDSIEAMTQAVTAARSAGQTVRMVGSGHSFTPLVQTDSALLSLDRYAGLIDADPDALRVTVRGGTKIKALGAALHALDLAQENLGDIDVQSIAGAISTGTHGTGIGLGSIATQAVALTLVTGTGDVITCSEDDDRETFKAAQVSLGALGILAEVTLRVVPAYRLDYRWQKMTLDDVLANAAAYRAENRNFEFFWIPNTRTVLAKFMNVTDAPAKGRNAFRQFNETVLENGVLWLLSETVRRFPASSRRVSRVMSALVSSGHDVNYSHRIFATPRAVRFQEMEYSLPVDALPEAITAIDRIIRDHKLNIHFPVECRFVRGDDIALSPAHGRDSAYIAVHVYKDMPYRAYFDAVEAVFRQHEGRPHWGKLHTATPDELRARYPQWDAFQSARQRLDPDGVFLNPYLRGLFGIEAG